MVPTSYGRNTAPAFSRRVGGSTGSHVGGGTVHVATCHWPGTSKAQSASPRDSKEPPIEDKMPGRRCMNMESYFNLLENPLCDTVEMN